jgi:2-keto-4-pentenoate hydratase
MQKGAASGTLRPVPAQDVILLARQHRAPFGVGARERVLLVGHDGITPDATDFCDNVYVGAVATFGQIDRCGSTVIGRQLSRPAAGCMAPAPIREKTMNAAVDTARTEKVASLLLEARRTGKLLQPLPESLRPQSAAEVYAIQDRVVAALGGSGGRKAGPPEGEDPAFYNILPARDFHASPATVPAVRAFNPEIEVEIGITFGKALPPRGAAYTRDEVAAAIGSVNPAIEIIGSRFVSRSAVDALTGMADCRNSAGVVVGPALKDWRGLDFSRVSMRLTFDGAQVAEVAGGAGTDTALRILTDLVNHAAGRSGGLRAGDVVITGARIRPVAVPRGTRQIVAEVSGLGSVVLNL